MKFIISRINEIFFSLRFAVIAVGHHQIPVYLFFHYISGNRKGILTFADILDDGCMDTSLLGYLPECCIFILLTSLYSALRKHPAIIPALVTFVQSQYLAAIYYHPATAHCFYHCKSSCLRCVSLTKVSIPFFVICCN